MFFANASMWKKIQKKIFFTKPIYLQTLSHNCDETYPEIDDPLLEGPIMNL